MKKRNILFVCLFICISFILNNIYAYELKISGEDMDGNGAVEFYTYVKSSGHSRDYYNDPNNSSLKDEQGFMHVEDPDDYGRRYGSYDIMGIIFHTAPLSNYTKTADKPYKRLTLDIDGNSSVEYLTWTSSDIINVAYADEYDKMINTSNWADYLSSNANSTYKISENVNKNDLIKASYLIRLDRETFDYPKYKLINNDTIVQFKYEIKTEVIQELYEKDAFKFDKDTGMYYIYVSFISQKNGTQQMETAAEFLNGIFNENSRDYLFEQYIKYNSLEKNLTQLQQDIHDFQIYRSRETLTPVEKIRLSTLRVKLKNLKLLSDDSNIIMGNANAETAYMNGLSERVSEAKSRKEFYSSQLGDIDLTNPEGWAPYVKGINIIKKDDVEQLVYENTETWDFTYARGYSGVNDYDNRLYIKKEIVEGNKDKTIYVNYVEDSGGVLSVLDLDGVTNEDNEHQIKFSTDSSWFGISNYQEYIKTNLNNEYEEFNIPVEDKNKIFNARYMLSDEVNAKVNLEEDSDFKYKYKNLVKYLVGAAGENYESLKNKIINNDSNVKEKENTYVKYAIETNKPLLFSFVYDTSREQADLKVRIRHAINNSTTLLPIAEGGNDYSEGTKIDRTEAEDKYETLYESEVDTDNAIATNLVTRYEEMNEDKDGNLSVKKVYNYNNKIKIEGTKGNNVWEQIAIISGSNLSEPTKLPIDPSALAQSWFQVRITFYYSPEDEPTQPEDMPVEICPTLSFSSNYSTQKGDCDDEFGIDVSGECSPVENTTLYVPTDKPVTAEISTPKYYINEDVGIIQKVTEKIVTIKILKGSKKYEAKTVKCGTGTPDGPCQAQKVSGEIKEVVIGENDLDENNKKLLKEYRAYAAKPTFNVDILDNYMKTVVKSDDITVEQKYTFHRGHNEDGSPVDVVKSGYNTYEVYKVTYIKVEVVGFNSYYLNDINFGNIDGEETKFIEENGINEKVSVISEDDVYFEVSGDYKNDIKNAIESAYSTGGQFVSTICPKTGETYNGWQESTKKINGTTISYPYCSDKNNLGVFDKMYAFTPEKLIDINEAAKDNSETVEFTIDGDKYNGERLSVANAVYYDYIWDDKEDNGTKVVIIDGKKYYYFVDTENATSNSQVNGQNGNQGNSSNPKNPTTNQTEQQETNSSGVNITVSVNGNGDLTYTMNTGIDEALENKITSQCSEQINDFNKAKEDLNNSGSSNPNTSAIANANNKLNVCKGKVLLEHLGESIEGKTENELIQEWNQYENQINSGKTITGLNDINFGGSSSNEGIYYDVVTDTKTFEADTNSAGLNIANPAEIQDLYISGEKMVSQVLGQNANDFELQVGVPTTIIPKISRGSGLEYNSLTSDDLKNYIGYYVYEFNFPITYNNKAYEPNTPIVVTVNQQARQEEKDTISQAKLDEWYDVGGKIIITPTATNGTGGDYLTSQVKIDTDTIYCTAVTKNVPSLKDITLYYEAYTKITNNQKVDWFGIKTLCDVTGAESQTNNYTMETLQNLYGLIRYDSRYFSSRITKSTTNLSRLYDFRITDCTDVNYKNVFRTNSAGNGVNKHTTIVYFSGIRQLDVYYNTYSKITTNTTIPLGPYKHTNVNYVEAPKLGYRISFDLKTSGYYNPNPNVSEKYPRTIVIFPKLYYISKDGKTFYEDVNAYYKSSNGKYVKIEQISNLNNKATYQDYASGKKTANGYEITFVPNDGYRNVLSQGITNRDDWFTKEQRILDMSALVLTTDMMCTNHDGFLQTWYGEYKLPNSTILVKNGETNLNNYLKDGYCGVVFYIGVVEERGTNDYVVMTYNTTDKQASSTYNTTQWDYEGYLGFSQSNTGKKLEGNLQLQLAKGIWNIDDNTYQRIKGTVLLYDLDNRAASDFD